MTISEFRLLLEHLAASWNQGDAGSAAACFTADAVYAEWPDKQHYVGREALFRFFGGDAPEKRTMSMAWHHIAFDPSFGLGFGEYTFAVPGKFQVHGITAIQVKDSLIHR